MILHLKEIMGLRGISSIALADMLGVSKVTVSYWINGKVFPDPEKLEKIANAVGVKVWELFKSPTSEMDCCTNQFTCPNCGTTYRLNPSVLVEEVKTRIVRPKPKPLSKPEPLRMNLDDSIQYRYKNPRTNEERRAILTLQTLPGSDGMCSVYDKSNEEVYDVEFDRLTRM